MLRKWNEYLVFPIVLAIIVITGCKMAGLPTSFGVAGDGTTAIKTRAEIIRDQGKGIVGKENDSRKQVIVEQSGKIMTDADTVKAALKEAGEKYAKLQAEYDKLYNSLPCRIWRAIWKIVTVWAVLGVTAMLLKGFGSGLWFGIGRQVLSFLPGANFFLKGSDWIQNRRASSGMA